MTFAWPFIFLLLPLPWLILRKQNAASNETQAPVFLPGASQWQTTGRTAQLQTDNNLPSRLILIALLLSWIALVIALARPQWVGDPIPVPTEGHDLLLAVDLSGSMSKEDMVYRNKRLNRLNTVKLVVRDFLGQRQGDRVGLVVFGDAAYIHTPITRDLASVTKLLMETQVEMAGPNTAIGDAIIKSIDVLRHQPEHARILILLTDGQNTAGEFDPINALEYAVQHQVKIYTIGIGSDSMKQTGLFGLFNNRVNPSKDLDEATLKTIAEKTQGLYFRAKNPEQLENIYQQINDLEPVEQDEQFIHPVKELYFWPLAAALFFYFLTLIMKHFEPQTRNLEQRLLARSTGGQQ